MSQSTRQEVLKNIRQCIGYERYDNPEVVNLINALIKGVYGQLLNFFDASLKLEGKERKEGHLRGVYAASTAALANQWKDTGKQFVR